MIFRKESEKLYEIRVGKRWIQAEQIIQKYKQEYETEVKRIMSNIIKNFNKSFLQNIS